MAGRLQENHLASREIPVYVFPDTLRRDRVLGALQDERADLHLGEGRPGCRTGR